VDAGFVVMGKGFTDVAGIQPAGIVEKGRLSLRNLGCMRGLSHVKVEFNMRFFHEDS